MYYGRTYLRPDRPFYNFRASKSGGRRILCSSETSCDRFLSSRVVIGSVGTGEEVSSPRTVTPCFQISARTSFFNLSPLLLKDIWRLERASFFMMCCCHQSLWKFSHKLIFWAAPKIDLSVCVYVCTCNQHASEKHDGGSQPANWAIKLVLHS